MKYFTVRVYGLVDTNDQKVFYVGRTGRSLKHRLRGHLKDARKSKNLKAQKIQDALNNGGDIHIVELAKLESPTTEEAEVLEQAWIDYYSLTTELTNERPASGGGIGRWNGVKYDWSDAIIARLGKETDREIADELGCSDAAVADQREKRGIAASTKAKWTAPLIARLGKEPDAAIARDMQIPFSCVRVKRVKLNIAPFSLDKWTPENLALLGKMTDVELSQLVGLSQSAVSWKRKKLGISQYPYKRQKGFKRKGEAWNKTHLPESILLLLGTMPDQELADLAGVTHRIIHSARQARNIASFSQATGHQTRFQKKTE